MPATIIRRFRSRGSPSKQDRVRQLCHSVQCGYENANAGILNIEPLQRHFCIESVNF